MDFDDKSTYIFATILHHVQTFTAPRAVLRVRVLHRHGNALNTLKLSEIHIYTTTHSWVKFY